MDDRQMVREERLLAEEFGLLFAEMGGTRMAGRVAAWLLLSDPPVQSLTDMAGALGVSKAAVSTAVRSLLQTGHVERVSEPGRRGDFYRSCAMHTDAVLQLGHIQAMRSLVRRCLRLVAGKDQTQSNYALLHEMEDFLGFLETEIPGLMERWQSARAARQIADVEDNLDRGGAP